MNTKMDIVFGVTRRKILMIKLYTFPTCPKCRIVKKKLEAVNLEYDLIEDENKTTEFANSIGIKEVPIMVVNE